MYINILIYLLSIYESFQNTQTKVIFLIFIKMLIKNKIC